MNWSLRHFTWRSGILIVVVLVLSLFAAHKAYRSFSISAHEMAARTALAQFDYSTAQHRLEEALRLEPNDPALHFLAAQAYRRDGKFDSALAHLKACDQSESKEIDAQAVALERILLDVQKGAIDPGMDRSLWAKIEEGSPQAPLILEALAQGHLYAYRLGAASKALDRLLQLEPDHSPARVWRGYLNEGFQKFDQALEDYRHAVGVNPNYLEARRRMAELLLFQGQAQEALGHWDYLLGRDPSSAPYQLGMAKCLRKTGEPDKAQALLERLAQEHPDFSYAFRELGGLALDQGRAAKSEEWLRRALVLDPYDGECHFLLAQCLENQDRKEEALKERALRDKIKKDADKLRECLAQLGRKPNDVEARYQAGVICLRNGQPEEGIRWLTGVLAIDKNHQPTQKALEEARMKK